MNERIKELCEQSKLYADDCTQDFTGDEPVVWMDYYTEKFAELIVKECATVQHKRFCEHGDVSWDILMEHFGVEDDWMQQAQYRAENGEW